MAESKVKVAVRVRPFNRRESAMEAGCIVDMKGNQTIMQGDYTKDGESKAFTFDESIWSHNPDDPHFRNQEQVFEDLGTEVLDNAFQGYNACIFAYGQTGSGKTYTMMGAPNDPGIIPRLCQSLFKHADSSTTADLRYKIEVSYMEIYNEEVRDLLSASNRANLRVREHKVMGPYVEGLTKLAVTDYNTIQMLMQQGNKIRKTAATKMNDTSSRSHAVFTLFMTEQWYDKATKQTGEKASRIALVDLAGSERQNKTGATGARLKEGANINKSLSTLGLVIKALAEQGTGQKKKKDFVPYRNSVLTWLLKDNLGGNAKTVMVATISPSSEEQEETITTLRYADSAKRIVNRAVVNEDPNARMIRELKEELERLRSQVGGTDGGTASNEELEKLKAQLAETEGLMAGMTQSWEEKLRDSQRVLEEHKQLLQQHGAVVKGEAGALKLESRHPHLVTVSTGLDFGINIYTIKEGMTRVGRPECLDPPQDILLSGEGIDDEHAILEFQVSLNEESKALEEVVQLHPIGDCYVNGELVEDTTVLSQGDAVQLGETDLFRFNHPTQALLMRQKGIAIPVKPAVLRSVAASQQEEKDRAMQESLEREKQAIRLERLKMEELAQERSNKQKEEWERAAEQKRKEEEARSAEAAKIAAEKAKENEVLMKKLAEMEAKLKMEEERRKEDELSQARLKAARDEESRLRREELAKQRADELAYTKKMEEEEARKLAELKATIEAERRDLEELHRLRVMQREAAELEQKRILEEQQTDLEAERRAAEEARLKARQAEEEAALQRARAEAQRVEAEQLQLAHETELERSRIEQERIRQQQMRIADIKAQQEKSKMELQNLRQQEARLGLASAPPSQAQAYNANGSTGTQSAAESSAAADMAKQLEAMRAQFAARQSMPEVANAGMKDDTDRKIEKFEEAKKVYLNKQQTKTATSGRQSVSGASMSSKDGTAAMFLKAKKLFLERQKSRGDQQGQATGEWNPFFDDNNKGKAAQLNPEEVQPDEVVQTDVKAYVQERNAQKENDIRTGTAEVESDKPEWLAHQWDRLQKQPWFRGFCGREDAELELKSTNRLGHFLVRVSESKPGHYAISVLQRDSKGKTKVEHMLVLPSYAGRDPSAPGGTRYRLGETSRYLFNSVPKLIAFYNRRPYHTNNNKLSGVVIQESDAQLVRYDDE